MKLVLLFCAEVNILCENYQPLSSYLESIIVDFSIVRTHDHLFCYVGKK
jgi:hypothetical protein